MEDLIRVRVANSAEDMRIGESSLERVVLLPEGRLELLQRRGEDFQSTRVLGMQGGLTTEQVERGPALGSGLGQQQAALWGNRRRPD